MNENNYFPVVSGLTKQNFHEVCRCCLLKSELSLFDAKFEGVSLINLYETFTSVQVLRGDELPTNICNNCANKLIDFYKFKKSCRYVSEVLKDVASKFIENSDNFQENIEIDYNCDNNDVDSDNNSVVSEKNESKKRKYECCLCEVKFNNLKELQTHRKDLGHEKVRGKRCTICNKIVTQFKAHMLSHTKEKSFECHFCGEKFSMKFNMKRHVMRHTGEKPYSCDVCGTSYIQSFQLEEHKRTHTGETPFVCDYCGQKFAKSSSHKSHLKRHTTQIKKCSLRTHESGKSQAHFRTRSAEKPFNCSVCSKSFAHKKSLRVHDALVHKGLKNYLCSECGRKFATKQGLQAHFRSHSGEKPFGCSFCSKSFSHRKSLLVHELIHKGLKPHVCGVCSKTFTQKSHLVYHERVHSGEKPYVCSYCKKSFSFSGSLKAHVRTHTGEKPFKCKDCTKSFKNVSTLKKHKC